MFEALNLAWEDIEMETNSEELYGNEDRKDRDFRRSVNAERIYTESACCDMCGDRLDGRGGQCLACDALLCTNCIGGDGRCDACSGSGRADLPEE
jgi:hypothetical protein